MTKKKKNPNTLPNGDNQLMYYYDGKFHTVEDHQFITTPEHQNFLIICEYGDWSPFLTWAEVQSRIAALEQEYPPGSRPNFFFRVVERL